MGDKQHKMTKSEFMARYINDMYDKRYREKHQEVDKYKFDSILKAKGISEKRRVKG